MDGGVEKCDVSSGYISMNILTGFQHNGSKSLMNYNDMYDMDMNANSQYRYVRSGINLLNSHNIPSYPI